MQSLDECKCVALPAPERRLGQEGKLVVRLKHFSGLAI